MKTGIKTVSRLGFWSAIISFIFGIAYVIAQIADSLGLLGQQGDPLGLIFLMLPSLFLASSFIISMVISIHYYDPEDKSESIDFLPRKNGNR
jgi:hypothetical protein